MMSETIDMSAYRRDPKELAEEIVAKRQDTIPGAGRGEKNDGFAAPKAARAKAPSSPDPDEALSGTEDEVALEFSPARRLVPLR
jgi:hypothetical protein